MCGENAITTNTRVIGIAHLKLRVVRNTVVIGASVCTASEAQARRSIPLIYPQNVCNPC